MPCRAVPDAPRPAKAVPRAGGRFRHRPGAYGGTPHAPRFCCVFRACGKTALSGFDPHRTEAFPELLTVQETPGWHSAPRGRPPGFDRYRAAEPAAIRCRTFSHGKRPRRHPDCPAPQTGFRLLHQKAVQLARRGETVERKARKVTVYGIRLITPFDGKRCDIEVDCSKGTYIRTLAEDIGNALGCGACLDSLERTVCGVYRAADAVTVETLEKLYQNGDTAALAGYLQSAEALFEDYPIVRLAPFYEKLALNGAEIYLKRARIPERLFEHGRLCRLYKENGGFYAVAELGEYPEGAAVKIKYRF